MDLQGVAELLGNFGEFFGAIAVLATLVYLVIQIKQNNKLLTATIYDSAVGEYLSLNRVVLESADYASISRRGLADVSQLNEDEAYRLNTGLRNFFTHVDKIFRLFRQGVIPETEWKRFASDAASILSMDAGRAFRTGNDYYAELFSELDNLQNPDSISFALN